MRCSRVWPGGKPFLGAPQAGFPAKHRDHGQADGERAPGGGGDDLARHDGGLSRGLQLFQHLRRQPVSAAAALAVLDVIRDEGLMERASATSAHVMGRLGALRHPLLAGVRANGLFFAADFLDEGGLPGPSAPISWSGWSKGRADGRDRGGAEHPEDPPADALWPRPRRHADGCARSGSCAKRRWRGDRRAGRRGGGPLGRAGPAADPQPRECGVRGGPARPRKGRAAAAPDGISVGRGDPVGTLVVRGTGGAGRGGSSGAARAGRRAAGAAGGGAPRLGRDLAGGRAAGRGGGALCRAAAGAAGPALRLGRLVRQVQR